jgi:hypothetical protein
MITLLISAQILPFTSLLVNGVYWDDRFPRLVTTKQLAETYEKKQLRLQGIADISCDIEVRSICKSMNALVLSYLNPFNACLGFFGICQTR